MSLRWRLALILAATVAVTVTFASVGAYVVIANELHDETDRFLSDRGTQLTEQMQPPRRDPRAPGRGPGQGMGPPPEQQDRSVFDQPDALVQYVTTSPNDRKYANSGTKLPITDADRAVASGSPSQFRDVEQGGTRYRVYTTRITDGSALQIAREVTSSDEVLAGLRVRMFFLVLAGTALAAAVGWLVARRTVRPVEQLTLATEQVAATQQFADPIPVTRHDEVGRLAESFNAMLAALSDARTQQQRLVQDASHELRTPLTSLRTNIEVLSSADRLDPADRTRLIDDVGLELVELTDLVNELVVLAQARSPEDEPPIELELDDLVETAVLRARRRTGREIELHAAPTIVRARPSELDRAVSNLLSNAAKFSPSGSPIEVRVTGGRVEVRDHGPGIAPADRSHVFERFYRSDEARSAPGSGLGLAIVDQVVRAADGSVFVEDAPGGGAIVGFVLPTHGGGPIG